MTLPGTSASPAPASVLRRQRRPRPCPCCGQPEGICPSHRERLAGFRAELAEEGRRKVSLKRNRPGAAPTCCFIGCFEPRQPACSQQ